MNCNHEQLNSKFCPDCGFQKIVETPKPVVEEVEEVEEVKEEPVKEEVKEEPVQEIKSIEDHLNEIIEEIKKERKEKK